MQAANIDFGNMCQMFLTTLENIRKANEARCPEEVSQLCRDSKRAIIRYREDNYGNRCQEPNSQK